MSKISQIAFLNILRKEKVIKGIKDFIKSAINEGPSKNCTFIYFENKPQLIIGEINDLMHYVDLDEYQWINSPIQEISIKRKKVLITGLQLNKEDIK